MSTRQAVGAVALATVLAGCGSAFEPGAPPASAAAPSTAGGSYDFQAGARSFSGTWTLWDPTICTILLGPEEQGEPLAQLIINLSVDVWFLTVNPYVNTPTFNNVVMPAATAAIRTCDFPERTVTKLHGSQMLAASVTLSTSEVRAGTGAELDGRLYEMGTSTSSCSNRLTLDAIYKDYIVGELCFMLDRVIVNPGDPAETIEVRGTFLAVRP